MHNTSAPLAARRWPIALAALVLACAGAAQAQATPPADDSGGIDCTQPEARGVVKCFSVDLSIPTAPGLAIVGLAAEDAITPGTPREFGMALVNGTDREGRPKAGLAIDAAPFKLLAPMTTREDYIASGITRLLWNTQVSLGVGKSTESDDKSQLFGLGLHTRLWIDPAADPIQDKKHAECMIPALSVTPPAAAASGAPAPPTRSGGEAIATPKSVARCYADLQKRTRNASAVTLSVAGSRVSVDGAWGHLQTGPQGVWLTGSYAFQHLPAWRGRDKLLLVGTVRRLWNEQVPDPVTTGATLQQQSTLLALKLEYRSDKRAFHLERSFVRASPEGLEHERIRRTAFGVEWQLDKNVWIVAAIGGESGRVNDTGRSFVQTGLKFATANEATFGPSKTDD